MADASASISASNELPSRNAEALAVLRTSIDASIGSVVTKLFLTAVFWLLISGVLSLVAGLKLQYPRFLDLPFLNYGRLVPALHGAFAFGWCCTAALGAVCWVVSRLNGGAASFTAPVSLGTVLWNAGVLLGVAANLGGVIRPVQSYGFPLAANVLLFGGFALILLWLIVGVGAVTLRSVAGKFLVGAMLWFGWSFLLGNTLLVTGSVRGVMGQVVETWMGSGVVWTFLVPVALGLACYFVRKVTGRPLFSAPTVHGLFWIYFVLAGLSGVSEVGGALPLWLSSLSSSAAILVSLPVLGIVYNLFATAKGSEAAQTSPTLRFVLFGAVLLLVGCLLNSFGSVRFIGHMTRMSLFDSGVQRILLGGAVSLVLFGAIYFIMPRLSGGEWLSSSLISIHFMFVIYGVGLAGFMHLLSGLTAGAVLMDSDSLFSQAVETGATFYWGHTLGNVICILGYGAFAFHFLLFALRIGQPPGEPTLFRVDKSH